MAKEVIALDYVPQERQQKLHGAKARQILYGGAAGGGKALLNGTLIPTPYGFKKIEDIRKGDIVYGHYGQHVRVIDTETATKAYSVVEFDTHDKVYAANDHLWWGLEPNHYKEVIITTDKLIQFRRKFSIPVSHPIKSAELCSTKLPIDPYYLGLWLGDGDSRSAYITSKDGGRFRVFSQTELSKLNLICNKHIPEIYIFSRLEDRVSLFQGLMDSDGTATRTGQLEFGVKNKRLYEDFLCLGSSLGLRLKYRQETKKYKDKEFIFYRCKFVADFPCFRITRKLKRQKRPIYPQRRYINDVRYVGIGKCTCLCVEGGLFLVGKSFITTHNSHAARWDAIAFALQNPGFQGYLFRRKRTELIGTHIRRIKLELANTGLGNYSESRNAYEFYNDSVIYMCFADQEDDVTKYLSEEMHWLALDEASQFTPTQIGFLLTRVRLGGWKPKKDVDRLPRVVFPTNPGGPAHNYLKRKFKMGIVPAETEFFDETMVDPRIDGHKGWSAIFIPAKMSDNVHLDVDYGAAFGGLSPELREAYANGNWDVIVGQAIHNLDPGKHKVRSFLPPDHWTKFMVVDWGMAKPFSVGWYTVSEGATLKPDHNGRAVYLPSGAVIRFHEWYGWNGKEDQGCRLDPGTVARRINEIEQELKIRCDYRVADTEMWATKTGPSPIDYFSNAGLFCQQAVKDRVRNYNEVISRLAGNNEFQYKGEAGEHPMLFATDNCIHFWRTVPTLQIDQTNPEKGPSDKEENHVYDEVAYACASWPYVTSKKVRDEQEFAEELKKVRPSAPPYQTILKTNRQRSGRKSVYINR